MPSWRPTVKCAHETSEVTVPTEWKERMRTDWDQRARDDAMHYIMTERSDWNLVEFLHSGEKDVARFVDPVLERYRARRERALDVGCGIGRLAAPLARRFQEVDAVDISSEMIRKAQDLHARATNLKFLVGSGVDLNICPSNHYDLVFSYIVLQHIPDPGIIYGYLREFGRVLRPEGWALFQVPNDSISGHNKYLTRWQQRRETLEKEGRAVPFEDHDHAYLQSKIRNFETIVQQPVEFERVVRELAVHNVKVQEATGRGTNAMWIAAQKGASTKNIVGKMLSAVRSVVGR
jgi:ubiquinone/menaquinone biosynthesis C-methylase UbiE